MTDFLIKLFIKSRNNTSDIAVRRQYGRLSGAVGIVCNLFLSGMKITAGIIFHSISVLADGVNNLSDMGNSVITLIGFRLAAKPADKDHPFGHARYEYIVGLLVSFLIMMLGLSLLKTAIGDIFFPKETVFHMIAVWIMVFSIFLKLWLYTFYRKIAGAIDSVALHANAGDSLNDCIATAGVLIAFLLDRFFHLSLDGYVGVLVSIWVLYSGWNLVRETLSPLLGEAPDQKLVQEIEREILAFDQSIIGIHDMMVHQYGAGQCFATVHVEVPASQDILISHDIVDQIETHFLKDHGIQLVIHMDPVETDNPQVTALREKIAAIVTGISERLSIHDFRVVFLESHRNLIFDVAIPFDFPYSEEKLTAMIQEKAGGTDYCIICYDRQN